MNIVLPNWVLFLTAIGFVVWIIAGIEVFKAARAMRERVDGTYLRFGMQHPPTHRPEDDADWWKHE